MATAVAAGQSAEDSAEAAAMQRPHGHQHSPVACPRTAMNAASPALSVARPPRSATPAYSQSQSILRRAAIGEGGRQLVSPNVSCTYCVAAAKACIPRASVRCQRHAFAFYSLNPLLGPARHTCSKPVAAMRAALHSKATPHIAATHPSNLFRSSQSIVLVIICWRAAGVATASLHRVRYGLSGSFMDLEMKERLGGVLDTACNGSFPARSLPTVGSWPAGQLGHRAHAMHQPPPVLRHFHLSPALSLTSHRWPAAL